MKTIINTRIKYAAILLILLCLILFSLAGCAENSRETNIVMCVDDEYAIYSDAVSKMLPLYKIERGENIVFTYLSGGKIAEAFDAQAESALSAGLAKYWYPQYLATAVIAVDRDLTNAQINGWNDLYASGETVGFYYANMIEPMLMAAIAYGLEGEKFALNLNKAADLLAALRADNRLATDSFEPPVLICFDYQAAALIKNGRNIEIIVPEEGTLTYKKGLVSNTALEFGDGFESLLLEAGLRLTDGRSDTKIYPGGAAYENAGEITDYGHFNKLAQEAERVMRRTVLRIRLYTSADGREHQFFVMAYIIIIAVWTASVIYRTMHKGVRRAVLFTGIILFGWIAARLIKWQTVDADILDRWLWYGYYLFQLTLPIIVLWLAWIIDRPGGAVILPGWLRVFSAINAILIVLVFTNDLHNLIFILDYNTPGYLSDYGYGVGFYLVQAGCFGPVLTAAVIMIYKGRQIVRKKGIVFLIAFFLIFGAYVIGYAMRVPVALESDLTMSIGLFALLCLETAIRIGMIPVNSKYAALFAHSPLGMRITDTAGNIVLSSASAPAGQDENENTLVFKRKITGGYALWHEDITGLNNLHKDIKESVYKLTEINALLAEEEKIKRAVAEEIAGTELMTQLESEIAGYTAGLSDMIEQLENAADYPAETARVALLLCYVKRRCNLFFRERETHMLPAKELASHTDELAEIAGYSGAKIIMSDKIDNNKRLTVRRITLFYYFFYHVINWALQLGCRHIPAQLIYENENIAMRLMLPEEARSFQIKKELYDAVSSAGGIYSVKDLDDAIGISLAFPEGGGIDIND